MFHSFDYPDETGIKELSSHFWYATLKKGVLEFPRPDECNIKHVIRPMIAKEFIEGDNLCSVDIEENNL